MASFCVNVEECGRGRLRSGPRRCFPEETRCLHLQRRKSPEKSDGKTAQTEKAFGCEFLHVGCVTKDGVFITLEPLLSGGRLLRDKPRWAEKMGG